MARPAGLRRSGYHSILGASTFLLAVVAGLCAGTALLVDVFTGVGGFYVDGWLIAFVASAAAMLALFVVSTALGVTALNQRGAVPSWNRSYLLAVTGELIAIVGLMTLLAFGVGGSEVALLADVLVFIFVVGLIKWNVAIWRELQVVPVIEERAKRSLDRLADRIEDMENV
jgi:hypothetical protein